MRTHTLLVSLLLLSALPNSAQRTARGGPPRNGGAIVFDQNPTRVEGQELISFEGSPAGTILFQTFGDLGNGPIAVRGTNPLLGGANAALIFDSSHPTGGDDDLGTPNSFFGGPGIGIAGGPGPFVNKEALHNILIVAENLTDGDGDGLVDDPDDQAGDVGQFIEFDFSSLGTVTLHGMTYIDVEAERNGLTLDFFDANGIFITGLLLPPTGNNGVNVAEFGDVPGVALLRVIFHGSGAIDNLRFSRECFGRIGNFVWNDIDRDGIQDPSEPGIQGVTVLLEDLSGNVLATDVTDRNGHYRFDELCAGDYRVRVDEGTLPPGFVPSPCNAGPDDTVDNDCSPKDVTLPDNHSTDLTCDFGYNSPCSGLIGDYVWNDLDRDGIQDPDEPGLEGISVSLKDPAGNVLQTVTTGPFGFYSFMGLCAGTYVVCVDETTLPPDFVPSPCNVGADDTVDNDCSPKTVVLSSDFTQDVTCDFGYNAPCTGTIGDFVWDDVDCDGIQDPGELGIESVVVVLESPSGVPLATVSTGPNGEYAFHGLCAGDYVVRVDETTLPPEYVPSPCNAGGDDTVDNDCSPALVTLAFDDSGDLSIDFGFKFLPGGGQGCTPGYWKQPHHFDSWPLPFQPTTLFSDVFEDAFPGLTLVDVLSQGGGGLNALGRHTVAALLNAANPDVSYALTTGEVISLFDDLFPATTPEYNALKDFFEGFNELGCPLN